MPRREYCLRMFTGKPVVLLWPNINNSRIIDSYVKHNVYFPFKAANLTTSFKVYKEFAKSQIHYMLGDAGRSYVIGFGENYPMQPYHAAR